MFFWTCSPRQTRPADTTFRVTRSTVIDVCTCRMQSCDRRSNRSDEAFTPRRRARRARKLQRRTCDKPRRLADRAECDQTWRVRPRERTSPGRDGGLTTTSRTRRSRTVHVTWTSAALIARKSVVAESHAVFTTFRPDVYTHRETRVRRRRRTLVREQNMVFGLFGRFGGAERFACVSYDDVNGCCDRYTTWKIFNKRWSAFTRNLCLLYKRHEFWCHVIGVGVYNNSITMHGKLSRAYGALFFSLDILVDANGVIDRVTLISTFYGKNHVSLNFCFEF